MSRTGRLCLAGSLVVLGVAAWPAGAGEPEYESAKGGQVIILDEPCPLNQFPPIEIAFASPSFDNPGGSTTTVSWDGRVLNGAGQVRLGGEIFDGNGNVLRSLGTSGRNLNPFGRHALGFAGDPSGGFPGIQIQGGGALEVGPEPPADHGGVELAQVLPQLALDHPDVLAAVEHWQDLEGRVWSTRRLC